jgi:post-segregation antitoxin (ccd killing protein)
MPKKGITTEHVDLSLPVGMKARAKELGVNMSFYATKAIAAEIKVQENKGSELQ